MSIETAEVTTTVTADDHTFPLVDGSEADTTPTSDQESPAVATDTPTANGPAPKAKSRVEDALDSLPSKGGKDKAADKKTDPKGGKSPKPAKLVKAKPEPKERLAPIGFKEPTGVRKVLPMDNLCIDRRFQNRQEMFIDEVVDTYADLYRDNPDQLPAIKVVDIGEKDAAERKVNRYIVWDGFQRSAARRKAGMTDIPAMVVPGDWALAQRLSLIANATHGAARTQGDLRKAFDRLMNNEELKDAVLKEGVGNGGANRALAAAVGISKGLVSRILNKMGLTTRGDKIVNLPKKDDDKVKPAVVDAPEPGMRVESKEAIKSRLTAAIIHEMQFAAAQIIRRYQSLLERPDAEGLFKELANKHGCPVTKDQNPTGAPGEHTRVQETQYWPAADQILGCLDELAEAFKTMNTQKTS